VVSNAGQRVREVKHVVVLEDMKLYGLLRTKLDLWQRNEVMTIFSRIIFIAFQTKVVEKIKTHFMFSGPPPPPPPPPPPSAEVVK